MEQHYTIKQVSERLNLSFGTIRNYIKDGRIKAVQIAGTGTLRIPESEVKKLMEVK